LIELLSVFIQKKILISVVIPAKNEAGNISKLVNEILANLSARNDFEIIYVDDGSKDDTALEVTSLSQTFPTIVRLIRHQTSAGQSTSIYTGAKHARGRLIVTLDADGQNNPSDIPLLLKYAETFRIKKDNGDFSYQDFCIAGYRKARKDTAYKRLQSKVANRVRAFLLKDDTPDTGCGLKVFPKETFLRLPYFNHMHRYIPALVKRLGGKIKVVEVSHRDRHMGESKYGMWGRLFAGLLDMLGVMWLQKRNQLPIIIDENVEEQPSTVK
jgi:glycosyltransferase involved in cell wall biosynthesis